MLGKENTLKKGRQGRYGWSGSTVESDLFAVNLLNYKKLEHSSIDSVLKVAKV